MSYWTGSVRDGEPRVEAKQAKADVHAVGRRPDIVMVQSVKEARGRAVVLNLSRAPISPNTESVSSGRWQEEPVGRHSS